MCRLHTCGLRLAASPRILLLDEPVSGISESEADHAVATARKIARNCGVTLLEVKHNMRVVTQPATRITVVHQGRAICGLASAEPSGDERTRDLYQGTA